MHALFKSSLNQGWICYGCSQTVPRETEQSTKYKWN